MPYLTLLDKYIFAAFGTIFTTFTLSGVISSFAGAPEVEENEAVSGVESLHGPDLAASVLLVVVLLLAHVAFARKAAAASLRGAAKISAMGQVSSRRILSSNSSVWYCWV